MWWDPVIIRALIFTDVSLSNKLWRLYVKQKSTAQSSLASFTCLFMMCLALRTTSPPSQWKPSHVDCGQHNSTGWRNNVGDFRKRFGKTCIEITLNESMHGISASPLLWDIGAEQVRQFVRGSLSVAPYAKTYPRVGVSLYISFYKMRCYI